MKLKIMPKAALPHWVERLNQQYRVVGPKQQHGQYLFGEVETADDLHLQYPSSILPPKKYLVPQREVLLSYRLDGSYINAPIDPQPTVVLGVHTCDIHAIKLYDRIFSQGFQDQHYRAHRENTFLVSIECLHPCSEHAFCRDMDTLSVSDGFDLHMIDLGDTYALRIGTEKGSDLLKGFHHVFDALPGDIERLNETLGEKWPRFPYKLDFDVHEMPALLSAGFTSDLWDELGAECLGCGACTQVCPTCYCFDVTDEADLLLETGQRVRQWDSCQIHPFAMVAGGHNFREQLAARQRHRFMRKGKYQMDAYDMVGCVGCGRCARACLVHITPVNVFNELQRRSQAMVEEVLELEEVAA
jgi:sulfhydrogenase subunit beta (sulfur reductase)